MVACEVRLFNRFSVQERINSQRQPSIGKVLVTVVYTTTPAYKVFDASTARVLHRP